MAARKIPDRFLVAFSLAGEQRDLVRSIADAVEGMLGRQTVFLDEWYEHYLAGADADLKLQDIYGSRCNLAVVCISKHYAGKPWTLAEHEAIRARLMLARASDDPRARDGILPRCSGTVGLGVISARAKSDTGYESRITRAPVIGSAP